MKNLNEVMKSQMKVESNPRRSEKYCTYCGNSLEFYTNKSSNDPKERTIEERRGYHEYCYKEFYYRKRRMFNS